MTRRALRFSILAMPLAGLIACAERPDLSDQLRPVEGEDAWPTLLSSSALSALEEDREAKQSATDSTDYTAARARSLSWRAENLANSPVLTEAERTALLAALARND